jgi:hypothetical protein
MAFASLNLEFGTYSNTIATIVVDVSEFNFPYEGEFSSIYLSSFTAKTSTPEYVTWILSIIPFYNTDINSMFFTITYIDGRSVGGKINVDSAVKNFSASNAVNDCHLYQIECARDNLVPDEMTWADLIYLQDFENFE